MNRRSLGAAVVSIALAALFSACNFAVADISTVPVSPTFTKDVLPLLDDHCNLCHGTDTNRGAPGDFRLDTYDDADGIRGALSMASEILGEIDSGSMPPAAAWGDGVGKNGKELIKRWIDQGAPR